MSGLQPVLAAWGLAGATTRTIEVGNINRTFAVDHGHTGERFVLQQLNPIFAPEVHDDIDAVTSCLAAAGMTTPLLVPTRAGELWFADAAGAPWRLQTFVDGRNHSHATSGAMVRGAGALLGRFHSTLANLDHEFASRRPGVHDTKAHLTRLHDALAGPSEHPGASVAQSLGQEILARAAARPSISGLPARIVHGDPKLNNIMFTGDDVPICFIDLDTVSRMPVPVELGDAFRSWCNPRGEDVAEAEFEIGYFAAGLAGYAGAARELLTDAERRAIPAAIETITLELASRFCADILAESYFAWDRQHYAAAWEHNRVRAASQLALARSIADQRGEIEQIVATTFAAHS